MNLLLCGPPASGKSRAALDRFREIDGSHLVTPTATMAEHLGHELARSGFPVRPPRVGTLARLLDSWDVAKPAPRALLHSLIEQALKRSRPASYAAVAEFRGFHAAVADLFEEAPSAALASGACGADLAPVFRAVEDALAGRGMALRDARLRSAAARVRSGSASVPRHLVFDGFFTFAAGELELLEALARRTQVTVTLPESPVVRERLQSSGFDVRVFQDLLRNSRKSAFAATTPEREAEEIARRILAHAARGRRFREMGVVLRSREPYSALIESTLARFGIPAVAYFADPLERHPAVAYLAGLVKACLEGWDHAALLALMRMPVSGVGATAEGDRADFAARKELPGRGLPFAAMGSLANIEALRRERLDPPAWAERLKMLRGLIPPPSIPENPDRDQVHAWRSTAAALNAFDAALEQAAASFPEKAFPEKAVLEKNKLPLASFWKEVETVLAAEPLRTVDRRRDVVHVMDVLEARQWELPVVFVCGMLEREFPKYHREDPLLGDALRGRLGLETAAERQAGERFLFDLAVTRATEEVTLSYARFDGNGEKTLPSFFLEDVLDVAAEPCTGLVQPAPVRAVPRPALASIHAPALLKQLASTHRKLSASGIEVFLQCPFQFFAEKTMRLKERPPAPRDRMDYRVKGTIIHSALANWIQAPLFPQEAFRRAFEEECARQRVPSNYRTEAVRLELLRHFEAFVKDSSMSLGWRTRTEIPFEFPLSPAVTLRGRIDRLEIGPDHQALVIDYKYSAVQRIKERVEASEAGDLVQGGVYLLAAERALGLDPVGMLYCGLKKKVTWDGWHIPLPGLEALGTSATRDAMRDMMDETVARVGETFDAIAAGRVEAHPADADKCRFCSYREACRAETFEAPARAGAAS